MRRASMFAANAPTIHNFCSSSSSSSDSDEHSIDNNNGQGDSSGQLPRQQPHLHADQQYWHFQLAIPNLPDHQPRNQRPEKAGPSMTICHCRISFQEPMGGGSQQRLVERLFEMPVGTPIVCTGILQLNGWARKDGKGGCNWQCRVLDVRPIELNTRVNTINSHTKNPQAHTRNPLVQSSLIVDQQIQSRSRDSTMIMYN